MEQHPAGNLSANNRDGSITNEGIFIRLIIICILVYLVKHVLKDVGTDLEGKV